MLKLQVVGRVHIESFGCRATQADGAALAAQLARQGMECAAPLEQADVVILNSCTVTASADQDLRQAVRRVQRANPRARILVTGCYAQRAPEEIAALPGVEWVVGNSHKHVITEILAAGDPESPCHTRISVAEMTTAVEFTAGIVEEAAGDRTRPNLKIQDGCNCRCSFCIIPQVRGPSRSASPEWVIEQVRTLSAGHREIVLSGINLGRWGREPAFRLRLASLLRRLLEETGVERLRLSSVEPMDLSDDLLGLMASSPRIARHIHAPLQSGSDAVLRRMRRWYRARHYADRIRRAREWMPEAAIGADVMAGFPGETEAEFEQTRRLIDELPFTYLHVFTFSARPGTPASAAPDQVPMAVRKHRNRILRETAAGKNRAFRESLIGRALSVVTLDQPCQALSDNYVSVSLASERTPNRIESVIVGGLTGSGVREAAASQPARAT